MKNGLSFDVEDLELSVRESLGLRLLGRAEPLADHIERLLHLLREYGVKATFFISGRSVEPHPKLVERIAQDGHEIAAHNYSHRFVGTYRTVAEFRSDLERCVELIERETGEIPVGYRTPGFTLQANSGMVLDTLKEMGFAYDSSILGFGDRRQHGYKRGPDRAFTWSNGIIELPLSASHLLGVRFPVFGTYALRLLPYSLTARGLRRLNAEGRPGFLYLHPFELFSQPVSREVRQIDFPRQWIWLSRRGRPTERKLRRLLGEFEFAPYREFLALPAPVEPPAFF
jgi:polysaccharide deacetylase family protein (PEP-CTERM system associated)